MNEVHFAGAKVMSVWQYDGNLYARVGVPKYGNSGYDFATLAFPDGARRGLHLERGDVLDVIRGHVRNVDEEMSFAEWCKRAGVNIEDVPEDMRNALRGKAAQHAITHIEVAEYEVVSRAATRVNATD